MKIDDIIELHGRLDREDKSTYISGFNWFMELQGEVFRAESEAQAIIGLKGVFHTLLADGKKTEAALLCWGQDMFDPRARAVKLIWSGLADSNKTLIIGGGS